MRYGLCLAILSILSFAAFADVVNVYEETECGGVTMRVAERMLATGRSYRTAKPPAKNGWIFTHWTISTDQDFENRDVWGRAFDENPYKLYEKTTLTAHYLPVGTDSDNDGVADGNEIYWYGDLFQNAASDTDGDGFTFAQELANGTNPLMADLDINGPVKYADGALNLYNPSNYGAVVIRSEPEGALFATMSEVYRPGTKMSTRTKGTFDPATTSFAYWTFNGVRQADVWGRTVDSTGVVTDGSAMEIVAVVATDYETRMKLYWYGDDSIAMTSDTDGDGLTFAQELAGGSNPLMADGDIEGPVKYADGEKLQYNPYDYQPYTLMSDPEGALFPTTNFYVRGGTKVNIGTQGSSFTYWKLNGVEQRDAWGRAMDTLSFRMPSEAVTVVAKSTADYETRMKLYWYGTTDVAMDSDTDGDGLSFAEELANGSSPLMADGDIEGPVKYADSQLHEANLQPYEQVDGLVADGRYVVLADFGGAVTPTVADVDGDGILDIVVEVAEGETVVYLGCGGEGNPEFRKVAWQTAWASALAAAKPRSLDGLEFDVKPPADMLSWSFADVDGDGVEDLLVSDSEGRIWFYKGNQSIEQSEQSNNSYTLQHKVWGGSFAGFANGLRIAAVDWDDDGDLDCLAGTAEGKLMLLRDPKVGRPTNLKALVGVGNVKLDWDPNQQSRIRGYRVYRKDANDGNDEKDWSFLSLPSFESFGLSTTLPTYRDYPPSVSDFDYKVSSVSRHYVAGNSTPIESESPATEVVRASLGKVKFFWNDVAVKQGERAEVLLSIENSLNYDVAGKTQVVTYDPVYLMPLKLVKTGLTENVGYEESVADGKWTITLKSGKLAAGGGKFFTLVFDTLKPGTTKVGEATVTILEESAPYQLGDVNGDGKVDELDVRLLAQLKNAVGRKWTANQLKAGDFNGNGKLDNADYQALRELLKEKGLL